MIFDLNGVEVNPVQILDPALYVGAEYFNWFFTVVLMMGLVAFGIQVLCRLVARS